MPRGRFAHTGPAVLYRSHPLPGSSSHAAGSGARIMPWRQPGDLLINIPIASIAPRLDPDRWYSLFSRVAAAKD